MPGKALDQKIINTCNTILTSIPTLAREKSMLVYNSILLSQEMSQMLVGLYIGFWIMIMILILILLKLADIKELLDMDMLTCYWGDHPIGHKNPNGICTSCHRFPPPTETHRSKDENPSSR